MEFAQEHNLNLNLNLCHNHNKISNLKYHYVFKHLQLDLVLHAKHLIDKQVMDSVMIHDVIRGIKGTVHLASLDIMYPKEHVCKYLFKVAQTLQTINAFLAIKV